MLALIRGSAELLAVVLGMAGILKLAVVLAAVAS